MQLANRYIKLTLFQLVHSLQKYKETPIPRRSSSELRKKRSGDRIINKIVKIQF